MDILNLFGYGEYVQVILAVIGAFAAIAAITPNQADDAIVQKVLDIVNALGMNVGKAKNGRENIAL